MTNSTLSGHPRPTGGVELWAWVFMRVSGVLLLVLALGHLVLMHLIHSVDTINYLFVVQRLAKPFWRVYDWLLLSLALVHGMNGARTLADDYLRNLFWRRLVVRFLYMSGTLLFLLGTWVLVGFQGPPS